MRFFFGFFAGFSLAWWYRPIWMVKRLKQYVATLDKEQSE